MLENLTMPKAEESEIQILGSILQDGELINKVNLFVSDFYFERHKSIFSLMQDIKKREIKIAIDTFWEEAKEAGVVEKVGNISYLTYLIEQTPSTANLSYHVGKVKETSLKRKMISSLYGFMCKMCQDGVSLDSIKEEIRKDFLPILEEDYRELKIREEAFYGLAGEIVNTISPHSEADPVALLVNFLTAYGNVIGDSAHFQVEATPHPMRLFCVLVGDTSKGRKGTSWDYIEKLFEYIDPEWVGNIKTGLSSGEGLIWAVRDEIRKLQPVKEKGRVVGSEEVVVDSGVEDKRLLIIESEFASPLRIMKRDGNILSPIIRCVWDSRDLQILTKNTPAKATKAHISIIGHITREELVKYLSSTEAGNGFGNRFLWLYVRRSKLLPFGGGLKEEDLEPIIDKLRVAVEFGKSVDKIDWAEESRFLWEAVYPKLSEGKPGLVGSLIARAEAYVTRLACVYALLDLSIEIRPEHLKAALALWEYNEASVKFIFRSVYRTPAISKLERALKERPLTKTEIYNEMGRNYSAEEIENALNNIGASSTKIPTNGRPKEVWTLE